jgi:hypothetical protein
LDRGGAGSLSAIVAGMDIGHTSRLSPHSAEEYTAFAVEAIERSEHADDAQDRLELVGRAQAWAMLGVGETLARIVEILAARRAGR